MTAAPPRPSRSAGRLATLAICAAALTGALALLYAPISIGDTLLAEALSDLAHLPLFAGVALVLLAASRALLGGRWGRRAHYAVALAAAVLLGAISEGAQFFTARDADLLDLLRNLGGAAGGLAVAATLDPVFAAAATPGGRRWRRAVRAGVAAVVLASLVPLVLVGIAYRQRELRAPVLLGFDSAWERPFVTTRGVVLEATAPPEAWTSGPRGRVGRILFSAAPHPFVVLSEPVPDWREYRWLVFETYSPQAEPVRLDLWLRDAHHRTGVPDSWAGTLAVEPGAGTVRIPLERVARPAAVRPVDLSRVRAVILLAHQPPRPFTVFLDEMRLEP